jgi:hypothetical protein
MLCAHGAASQLMVCQIEIYQGTTAFMSKAKVVFQIECEFCILAFGGFDHARLLRKVRKVEKGLGACMLIRLRCGRTTEVFLTDFPAGRRVLP